MNFNTVKVVKTATAAAAVYLLCFGFAMAFFPIRPFWNDEWRLLYNIKFKDVHQLWGRLDLLQECPRVYLSALKGITAYFDYNYISIRLPAYITTIASVLLVFHLRKKLFTADSTSGYLFILILISSQTFTDYMTQVKQYEMDIFLSLVVLWQLVTLHDIIEGTRPVKNSTYCILCFSAVAVPFFSYIYPIAIAPVFPVIVFSVLKKRQTGRQALLAVFLPLVLAACSILIFYLVDVRHLMANRNMYASYLKMLGNEKNENRFITDFWYLFALIGSGLLFEIIFGVLGIGGLCYGLYSLARKTDTGSPRRKNVQRYSLLLVVFTLCLFLSGRLLGGVARLAAFTVPAISLLIVLFLHDLKTKYRLSKLTGIITVVLFLGLFGNIISTCINTFTDSRYRKRMDIYYVTSDALRAARQAKIPLMATDGVRGDGMQRNVNDSIAGFVRTNTVDAEQIAGVDTLSTEVIIKVNPEYKTWAPVSIYLIPDLKWIQEYMRQLPPRYNTAIACDGTRFIKCAR